MKFRLTILALFSALALRAADALPLFNATLTMGKTHRFVLIDDAGKTSSFLGLGESFAGYKLKAYDPKTGVLEVERDGQVSRLTIMADAAIINAPAAAAPATVADAEALLNKIKFEDMMERALGGQKKAILAQFQQVGASMVARGADKAEAEALQKKMADEILGVLDAKQMKADVAKIYSELFTKQEMDQVAAFYSTPLGEMLAAKQPAVQEKLGAVIQGRMAEVMPRVQKMAGDFAATLPARSPNPGAAPSAPPAPPKK